MYLNELSKRKKNNSRHTRIIKYLNSNFIKHAGILKNRKINKTTSYKIKKKSKSKFKFNQKFKNRNVINWNLSKPLFNEPYRILSTKKTHGSSCYTALAVCKIAKKNKTFKNFNELKIMPWLDNSNKKNISWAAGSLFYIKIFDGFRNLTVLYNQQHKNLDFYPQRASFGGVVYVGAYFLGSYVYCFKNSLRTSTYATSAGSYCTILVLDELLKTADIKLPSGITVKSSIFDMCIVGRCSNIFAKHQVLGKASNTFFLKKKKVSVRGVAKNPVDHPNGGRSKVKKPFKNVWGAVAKKNK